MGAPKRSRPPSAPAPDEKLRAIVHNGPAIVARDANEHVSYARATDPTSGTFDAIIACLRGMPLDHASDETAAVLVNERLEVLYFYGATDRFLAQPTGAPTRNLTMLTRDSLRAPLRAALRETAALGYRVTVARTARAGGHSGLDPVKISVVPAGSSEERGPVMLVTFEERHATSSARSRSAKARLRRARGLEDELQLTREELKFALEELETRSLHGATSELYALNEELDAADAEIFQSVSRLETANRGLHHLLNSMGIAVACLDRDLCVVWCNPALRSMMNLGDEELVRPITELRLPFAGDSLVRDVQAVHERGRPIEASLAGENGKWFLRRVEPFRGGGRSGDVIVTFVDVTCGHNVADAAIAARMMMAENLEQKVRDRTERLHAVVAELAAVEERERQTLAQDLHDDIAQILSIIKLRVATLGRSSEDSECRKELREVVDLIDQADRSVRSLAFQLSPPILHQRGLGPALHWLGQEMTRLYGLAVQYEDDGAPKPLSRAQRTILFRTLRELLVNVAKHARVSVAHVSARVRGDELVVTVEDGGAGFDPQLVLGAARTGTGMGLSSVRERLLLIGGKVDVYSKRGEGTRVTLNVGFEPTLAED